jgi:hypothetical protein
MSLPSLLQRRGASGHTQEHHENRTEQCDRLSHGLSLGKWHAMVDQEMSAFRRVACAASLFHDP